MKYSCSTSVLAQKFACIFRPCLPPGCVAPPQRIALDTQSSSRLASRQAETESARELLGQDTSRAHHLIGALTSFAAALALLATPLGARQVRLPLPSRPGVWIGAEELRALPASGSAWEALELAAALPLPPPNIGGRDDNADVLLLAKALVAVRTEDPTLRDEVVAGILLGMGTETCGDVLALARNLAGYVIAADLVDLTPEVDSVFRSWLASLLEREFAGETLRSIHERRPNNWGTHAGGARAVIASYLGDRRELARVAQVFKGWLGDRSTYSEFVYGSRSWQADQAHPIGIAPLDATRDGHSIDGVLPDDQRRSGDFTWPPPKENYVYEALQGALLQALVLARANYDVWEWENRALLRAFLWLENEAAYPAVGDDTWQPCVINHFYPVNLATTVPAQPGKNLGWTDWVYARPFSDHLPR